MLPVASFLKTFVKIKEISIGFISFAGFTLSVMLKLVPAVGHFNLQESTVQLEKC